MYVTFPLEPPSHTDPHPTALGHHRIPGWAPYVIQSFLLAIYFTISSDIYTPTFNVIKSVILEFC